MSTLGTGEALLAKINTALSDQGLRHATRVSAPESSSPWSASSVVTVAGIVGGAAALLVALAGQYYYMRQSTRRSSAEEGAERGQGEVDHVSATLGGAQETFSQPIIIEMQTAIPPSGRMTA